MCGGQFDEISRAVYKSYEQPPLRFLEIPSFFEVKSDSKMFPIQLGVKIEKLKLKVPRSRSYLSCLPAEIVEKILTYCT
jgi:hypothetical protein